MSLIVVRRRADSLLLQVPQAQARAVKAEREELRRFKGE
jgi:hypothetical protein